MPTEPIHDEQLTAFALGELRDEAVRAAQRTVNTDEEARRYVEDVRRLAGLLGESLREEKARPLSPGQVDAIHAAAHGWRFPRALAIAAALALAAFVGWAMLNRDTGAPAPPVAHAPPESSPVETPEPPYAATVPPSDPLEDLPVELPEPAFVGTPRNPPPNVRMGRLTGKDRGPYRLPHSIVKDLRNLAYERPVDSSDRAPLIGGLEQITDGDKEHLDGRWVELAPGPQWVQIDLGDRYEGFAILIWHNHMDNNRVYRDVIVQVSDEPDFTDPRTVFNNDHDNSSGLGVGRDFEYYENYEGLLVPLFDAARGEGVRFRYVRAYSKGSTSDDANHYTEIEVWGR